MTRFYKEPGHLYALHDDGQCLHVNTEKPLVNRIDGTMIPIGIDQPRQGVVECTEGEFSDAMVNAFLDMGAHKYLKLPGIEIARG